MYIPFRVNSFGNNFIVPAQSGKSVEVYGIFFQANALTSFKLVDGTSGPDLIGQVTYLVGGGLNLPDPGTNVVMFKTSVGEGLNLKITSLTGDIGGAMVYQYY